MPTKEQSIATKDELVAARNAALAAVWSAFYAGLNLTGLAHELGDPRESDWQCDDFGTEAEKIFRSLIERRDQLQAMMRDRLLTPLEEAKARAGELMPVSVGNLQFPTYHRAALEILRRFVMMLSIGRPFAWPSWVYELERERRGRPANASERHAYYKSLLEDVMSFDLGSNVEEMETGIRCECARALAAAPDARQPLSGNAAATYEILMALPSHCALTAPKLIDALGEQDIHISESILTTRVIPELKDWGVRNKPRIGYHIKK